MHYILNEDTNELEAKQDMQPKLENAQHFLYLIQIGDVSIDYLSIKNMQGYKDKEPGFIQAYGIKFSAYRKCIRSLNLLIKYGLVTTYKLHYKLGLQSVTWFTGHTAAPDTPVDSGTNYVDTCTKCHNMELPLEYDWVSIAYRTNDIVSKRLMMRWYSINHESHFPNMEHHDNMKYSEQRERTQQHTRAVVSMPSGISKHDMRILASENAILHDMLLKLERDTIQQDALDRVKEYDNIITEEDF